MGDQAYTTGHIQVKTQRSNKRCVHLWWISETPLNQSFQWNVRGRTAWCETNKDIGSMQKWRFIYTDSQYYL